MYTLVVMRIESPCPLRSRSPQAAACLILALLLLRLLCAARLWSRALELIPPSETEERKARQKGNCRFLHFPSPSLAQCQGQSE